MGLFSVRPTVSIYMMCIISLLFMLYMNVCVCVCYVCVTKVVLTSLLHHLPFIGVSHFVLSSGQDCKDESIRLGDSMSVSIELCHSEFWDTVYFLDTVCGNDWNFKNSLVVCKELGYQDVGTYTNFR